MDIVQDDVRDEEEVSGQYGTGPLPGERVTVYRAAEVLGVTVDAVRKRIQRGTIPHERHEDGRVYVLLDAGALQDARPVTSGTMLDGERDELVESFKEQISYLRRVIGTRDQELAARTEELRRKDHIVAALTERIPELSPPPREAPGSPETASEDAGSTDVVSTEPQRAPRRRSWLLRFFFGS